MENYDGSGVYLWQLGWNWGHSCVKGWDVPSISGAGFVVSTCQWVLCLLCVVCLIETAVFSGIGFCFRFSNLRFSEMGIHWRHVCVGFICIWMYFRICGRVKSRLGVRSTGGKARPGWRTLPPSTNYLKHCHCSKPIVIVNIANAISPAI